MHWTRNINIFCVFIEATFPSWHLLQWEWLWFSPSLLPPSLPPPFSLPPFPLLLLSYLPPSLPPSCRLEFYGVELFTARDHHGVELGLGITGNGIGVFKNRTIITTFSWWALSVKKPGHWWWAIISHKTWPLVVSHYQSWSLATCSLKLRVSILDFAFSKAAIQNPKRNTGVWV